MRTGQPPSEGPGPELTAEQYARITELFGELCDAPAGVRTERLAQIGAEDPVVRHEVEGMLAVDAQAGVFGPTDARGEPAVRASERPAGAPPAHVGKYRIVRLLGEGGMGRVYEAVQEFPHRAVALKVIRFGTIAPALLRRFTQEADILARLQHVGIAQIYEAGQAEVDGRAQPYFAMELVDGPPLTRYAEQHGLTTRLRLELLARVCDAVHHAHEKGVVHRDLKPGNILVSGAGQPKVLDFGVARAAEVAGNSAVTMTVEGQILGTLAYMAPEQATDGEDRIGPATDVYALGAIGFELLTGRPPHDLAGLSLATALRILTQEPAPRAGALAPTLRGDVETIIGKALEMEPTRRYANAAAMGADIRRFLGSRPITARPAGRAYRARKFVGRHRALAAGALATLVTLCTGLAVSVTLGLKERQQRRVAQQRETLARQNAVKAAGGVMNAALASRSSERPWAAVKQLLGVPRELVGWEARYVARQLPWVLSGAFPGRPEFAGGGDKVVTCDPSGMGGVWEVDDPWSGRELVPHAAGPGGAPAGEVAGVLIRPDLAAVVDVSTRRIVWSVLLSGRGLTVGCSADGSTLAVTMEDGEAVCYRAGGRVFGIKDSMSLVCWADGKFAAHRTAVGEPSLLDGQTGRVLHTVSGDGTLINGVGPSPNYYYFQPARGVVAAMDVRAMKELWRAEATGPTWWSYSRDGGLMLVPEAGGVARVHDAASGAVVQTLAPCAVGPSRFSADGSTLVVHGIGGRCEAWDLRTGLKTAEFDHGRGAQVAEPDVSADGRRVVVRSPVWDLPWVEDLRHPWQEEAAYVELKGHTQWVYHVAVSHDGTMIASEAPLDPIVRLWDAFTGEQIAGFERGCDLREFEAFLAFSSDDSSLVTTSLRPGETRAGGAAGVIAWGLATGKGTLDWPPEPVAPNDATLLDRMAAHLGDVRGARLSARAQVNPAGNTVARGGWKDGPGPLEFEAIPGARQIGGSIPDVFGISYHPSGKLLACGELGRIRIVDVARGEVVAEAGASVQPRPYLTRRERVYGVAYSPEGSRLAAGMADGSVTIYETEFHQPMLDLPAHHGAEYSYVYSLVWTPDGTRLITASGDKTLRIWDGLSPFTRRRQLEAIAAAREPMRQRIAELMGRLGDAERAWEAVLADGTIGAEARIAARRALIERWAGSVTRASQ